jgi:hypothetical protein
MGIAIGVVSGIIIAYLLKGFSIWQAEIALRLRPELINLNWWEAFWSGHFYEWQWLVNPNIAMAVSIVIFALCFGYIGAMFGSLFDK